MATLLPAHQGGAALRRGGAGRPQLVALQQHVGDNSSIWPSPATLPGDSGYSKSLAQGWLPHETVMQGRQGIIMPCPGYDST